MDLYSSQCVSIWQRSMRGVCKFKERSRWTYILGACNAWAYDSEHAWRVQVQGTFEMDLYSMQCVSIWQRSISLSLYLSISLSLYLSLSLSIYLSIYLSTVPTYYCLCCLRCLICLICLIRPICLITVLTCAAWAFFNLCSQLLFTFKGERPPRSLSKPTSRCVA